MATPLAKPLLRNVQSRINTVAALGRLARNSPFISRHVNNSLGDNSMKCELLEGLSSFLVSLCFCALLIMPATIAGCAEKDNPAGTGLETETDATNQPAAPDTTDRGAVRGEQNDPQTDETDLTPLVP